MKKEPEYVNQLCEMYQAGKNQKEIVDTLGISYFQARYWLKKKGLYDPERRQHGHGISALNVSNIKQKQDAENRLAIKLLQEGFSYISGYGESSTITVDCLACGKTFERNAHEAKRHPTSCPHCLAVIRAKKRAEENQNHKTKEEMTEYWKQYRAQKEQKKQEQRDRLFDELHKCPICSREFTIRIFAQENGLDPIFIPSIEYCSKKCRRKALKMASQSGNHVKRAIARGCAYEKGISLTKLIERDGIRCALCGEPCDFNDRSYGNGSGPLYPSIDHIIPISKGGGHTWDNVQVAHLYCNSLKNDKVGA